MKIMKTMGKHRRSAPALLLVACLLPSGIAHAKGPAAAPASPASPTPNAAAPAVGESPRAEPEAPKSPGESCSSAYERTQTEKLAGHYVAASAAALECSQLQCSSAIVQECVRFYSAL